MKNLCIKCGNLDYPSIYTEGTFIGELCVWIAFGVICSVTTWLLLLIPFTYTLYRVISKKNVCSLCNSTEIIPENSPNAKNLLSGKNIIN